jgi:hypothetical protein
MSDHARKQKARQDTDGSSGSEKGDSDKDNNNRKQSPTTSPTLKSSKQQQKMVDRTQLLNKTYSFYLITVAL